jgi:hypothetical protein
MTLTIMISLSFDLRRINALTDLLWPWTEHQPIHLREG